MIGKGSTGGNWPVADIIMMSDFPNPENATSKTKGKPNPRDHYLRIHMDVRYSAKDKIEAMIQAGDLHGACQKILAYNDDGDPHPRAEALLAAAFGKFDGVAPPTTTSRRSTKAKPKQESKRKGGANR